jgi:spore maturation protein CgeB
MRKKNKVLIIGEFTAPQYEEAISISFEKLGWEVRDLSTDPYVNSKNLINKIYRRLMIGPNFLKLWSKIIDEVKQFQPDLIYFRKPFAISPKTLKTIKTILPGVLLFEYWNDDPFGPDRNKRWNFYIHKTIRLYDQHFIFRELNRNDFIKNGAKNVEVLLPYYSKNIHFANDNDFIKTNFITDSIFIGHGENDARLDYFDEILTSGVSLKLAGSGFDKYASGRKFKELLPASYLKGDKYRIAIQDSLCSLCFYSKRNRDFYTTRVFEIPACGGLLVAERNDIVVDFFKDREEAFFFSSVGELIEIINYLKNNISERNRIARNGYLRVLESGHGAIDRAMQIIEAYKKLS